MSFVVCPFFAFICLFTLLSFLCCLFPGLLFFAKELRFLSIVLGASGNLGLLGAGESTACAWGTSGSNRQPLPQDIQQKPFKDKPSSGIKKLLFQETRIRRGTQDARIPGNCRIGAGLLYRLGWNRKGGQPPPPGQKIKI